MVLVHLNAGLIPPDLLFPNGISGEQYHSRVDFSNFRPDG